MQRLRVVHSWILCKTCYGKGDSFPFFFSLFSSFTPLRSNRDYLSSLLTLDLTPSPFLLPSHFRSTFATDLPSSSTSSSPSSPSSLHALTLLYSSSTSSSSLHPSSCSFILIPSFLSSPSTSFSPYSSSCANSLRQSQRRLSGQHLLIV